MPPAPAPHGRPRRPRPLALLSLLLVPLLLVAGCGGGGGEEKAEKSPAQVMESAKKSFDDAASVAIALSTTSVPTSGNGVLGATGTVTHAPAYEGDVKVVISGLTATVPVTSVGGKVYAKLPLQTKYTVIDPSEYGAPDPADFGDPTTGLSSLLTQVDGLEKGKETRSADAILTSYSGTLPGAAVKKVIPSADAAKSYDTVIGVDDTGHATTVKITGPFFAGGDDVTYDVKLSGYGKKVTIAQPTA